MSTRWLAFCALVLVAGCPSAAQTTDEAIVEWNDADTSVELDETPCDRAGKTIVDDDLNGDAVADVWRYSKIVGGVDLVVTCHITDLDYDGSADHVAAFDDTGALLWEKFDLSGDDEFDRVHRYRDDGSYDIIVDTDYDGSFDSDSTSP